jgi:hypothetical protein
MALGTADAVAGKPVIAISPQQLGRAERWLGLLVRFPDVIRYCHRRRYGRVGSAEECSIG